MKTIYNKSVIAFAVLILALSSCKKEKIEPEPAQGNGTVSVNLKHHWGISTDPFALGTQYIHPMNGDTMTFSTYKYYISNFKLKKSDGTWYTHPESYFLVDLSNPASSILSLTGVPEGEYTDLQYTMGVDSTRNCSGAQAGALSTTNNMFWSWNSGYIMIKAEGQSPNAAMGDFAFHLGGYKGEFNVVTVKNQNFSSNNLTVTKDKNSEIHFNVNTAMTWCTSGSCAGTSMIMMPGTLAKQMATDFYNGINFDHIVD
ncbi:MAG: MbnP family protein [Flavobacteriia bacterium]